LFGAFFGVPALFLFLLVFLGFFLNIITQKFDDEDEESSMLHSRRLQHVSARITLRVKMHCDDDATAEALSFCRVAVANSEELDEIDTRGYHGDSFVSPVSARNEIAALFMLANVCRTRLKKYPTSLQHILERLADDATLEPFSNHRNALIVIKSELEILHFFILLSELAAPIFSMPIDVAIRHVQDNFSGADTRYNDGARYMRSVVYDLQSSNSGYASY
jgi:hypothetical protein